MLRTEVGYIGGRTSNPSYHDLADHAEGVDVCFDPERISRDALLDVFWKSHEPTRASRSTQYKAALYCHSEAERAAAVASRDRLEAALGRKVHTEILLGHPWYPAEGYHQKWCLRRHGDLFGELLERFGSEAEALRSTAAAQLNGLLGGSVTRADFDRAIEGLALSDKGRRVLEKSVRWAA